MMDKHFIIYKTTNRINGRFYIGMHVTSNIDDGYLGSGRRIKAEIKKYGRENFDRIVLDELPSKEAMAQREAELVTEELRSDPLCLNLKNGGEGGWDYLNSNSDIQRAKGIKGNAAMSLLANDPKWASLKSAKTSASLKEAYSSGRKLPTMPNWVGRNHRDETKAKMSSSAIGKHDGWRNSQFGTCWVTKDSTSLKVKIKDLDAYLADGYVRGRTMLRKH